LDQKAESAILQKVLWRGKWCVKGNFRPRGIDYHLIMHKVLWRGKWYLNYSFLPSGIDCHLILQIILWRGSDVWKVIFKNTMKDEVMLKGSFWPRRIDYHAKNTMKKHSDPWTFCLTKGCFTLWLKDKTLSISTNHVARTQEFTLHIRGQSPKACCPIWHYFFTWVLTKATDSWMKFGLDTNKNPNYVQEAINFIH